MLKTLKKKFKGVRLVASGVLDSGISLVLEKPRLRIVRLSIGWGFRVEIGSARLAEHHGMGPASVA